MSRRFCENCGAELTPGTRFCVECGAEIAQDDPDATKQTFKPVYCPMCGAQNEPGSRHCEQCGAALVDEPSQPTDTRGFVPAGTPGTGAHSGGGGRNGVLPYALAGLGVALAAVGIGFAVISMRGGNTGAVEQPVIEQKQDDTAAQQEAEEKAKQEAEEKAKQEAEEKAKQEAEEKAKQEAEEKAKQEAEEKAKQEQALKEAEERAAKAEAEAEEARKAQAEAEARARANENSVSYAQSGSTVTITVTGAGGDVRSGTIHRQGTSERVFPDSNSRYLSSSEVAALTDAERCIAWNEIIAASNGYAFKNGSLAEYFNNCSWYYRDPNASSGGYLTDAGAANVELLQSYTDNWWKNLAAY